MEDRLWTTQDVCEYLGWSPRTLHRWGAEQIGPPALQFGTMLRFVLDQIRVWAHGWVEQGDVLVANRRVDAAVDGGLQLHPVKGVA